jgi:prevent-host-death family protein
MKEVGLYEAKTKLSSLVAEVEESGESIILTRHGKAVAQISPPSKKKTPQRGCLKSDNFYIADDFDTCDVGFEYLEEEDDEPSKVAEDTPPYKTK